MPNTSDKGKAKNAISKAAAEMGRKGGKSRSAAKIAAVRANGKKGGRPRRQAPEAPGATKNEK